VKYNLWLGKTQVTGANKNNIPGVLGGGKAKYDPVNRILTFTGNVMGFSGKNDYGYLIYSNEGVLTIKGKASFTTDTCGIFVGSETDGMISVDGDTSTNDTLLVLANGEAQNAVISAAEGPAYEALYEALYIICRELAMQMAGDGEGATKLIEVNVQGMDTIANARTLAKSVICSSLTKAAVYGSDANWGRILCALGYAGVEFDPGDLQLYFVDGDTKMLIFTEGAAADYSEEEATELLKKEKVTILAQFHMGEASATAWGCDLTYDYVKINADYRS
jgi:glutamate N-acetyltransferase/amino-acid N-acetyltransferase